MRRISKETWQQIKAGYAAGIGLSEIVRKMNVPEGTVLARAKREGWTQQIAAAKHAIALTQSNAITPLQSIAAVMQERGERYRERVAGTSERVIGHVESMEADEILLRSAQVEKIDNVARRTFGVDSPQAGSGAVNLMCSAVAVQLCRSTRRTSSFDMCRKVKTNRYVHLLLDARSGTASRAGRHWLSDPDSPFGLRPDYATLFQPCRSVAGRFGALFAALLLAVSGTAQAATVNARSPSFADVSTAVFSAGKGDTVIVPAGTASWTKTLVINKPITLIGQTTVSYTNETSNDRTIILDDVSRSSKPPRAPIIHATIIAGDMAVEPRVPLLLIKGFTFRGSPNTPSGSNIAAIQLEGACPAVRISNCNFDGLYQRSIYTFGWIYGVMDNCLHTLTHFTQTGVVGMATYNGQKYGDGSWTEDAHWGSYKFFFTENNVVHNLFKKGGNMDAKRGARYVVRYSKLYDCAFIQSHGTEGDRDRGCRAIEFYNNICNRSDGGPGAPGGLRSGNILFHDNKYTGVPLGHAFVAAWTARMMVNFQPWGLASGDNPWDQNDPHGLYASGTAATASVVGATPGAGSRGPVETSFSVAGDLSAYNTGGYSIRNTRTGLGSLIRACVYNPTTNSTVITCGYNVAWNIAKVTFNVGDPFRICRVLRVLDQTGLGKGTLCSTPKSLNGAVNEASYAWSNTQANGTHVTIHSGAPLNPTFVEGRDYFNSAPPFAYKPYTYPHPLVNAIVPP